MAADERADSPGAYKAKLEPVIGEGRFAAARVAGALATAAAGWWWSWFGFDRIARDLGRCSTGMMRRLFFGNLARAWVWE